jgi:hypothetical protein
MNSSVVFELIDEHDLTQIDMIHGGLVPEVECYNDCKKDWDYYITESLCKLFSENKEIPETPKAKR